MRCPNCGYENPEGRRYCEECGEKIARIEAEKARARRKALREAARLRLELEKEGLDREEVERRLRRTLRSKRALRLSLAFTAGAALLILLIVILVLVLTGGESAPEKAVKSFFQSIKDKDVLTYLKHTEPDVYKMARSGEYQPDPYTEGIDYDYYVLENLETRLVKEEGDYAEVEVIGGYFEGFYQDGVKSGGVDFSQHPRLVRLVNLEGTWVVQDYATVKLPYPVEEVDLTQPEFPEIEEESQPTE